MESSRIFVRGLPPSFGEEDFRKHFSQRHGITDAKLFPHRRIGYVGYKNHQDAAQAAKFFNKTFINMSRIAVELATPAAGTSNPARKPEARPRTADARPRHEAQEENPLKRKRAQPSTTSSDPKLAEYLSLAGGKRSRPVVGQEVDGALGTLEGDSVNVDKSDPLQDEGAPSDEEYQQLENPKKLRKPASKESQPEVAIQQPDTDAISFMATALESSRADHPGDVLENSSAEHGGVPIASDADWLRSRTSRLLGLLDEDEEVEAQEPQLRHDESETEIPSQYEDSPNLLGKEAIEGRETATIANHQDSEASRADAVDANVAAIRDSKRLFLRNLAYDVSEDDLRSQFAPYGDLEEVHVPVDNRTAKAKGIAYIQYQDADAALSAFQDTDGRTFQGRLLHVLPASAKRETKLDEYAISKLPLKKQRQIRKRASAAASNFSWNSLYMNPDAVISSVADRLGVDKSAVLDPTSSDAAVKQAVAETHIIQETKSYFLENGVDLEAFKRSKKGDTAILVKNFSYGTKAEELRKLFEEHGQIIRFLMPPGGTIAIVEFALPPQARSAFAALAYRKLKDSVLFLEKAPADLFRQPVHQDSAPQAAEAHVSTADLLQSTDSADTVVTSTLFVKNLNFTTSSSRLAEAFKPLDGFMSAVVKTKTNPKQSEVLSMGFGFVEFTSKAQAQAALAAMDGYTLDGHQLVLRTSQKGMDAAEERRREDRAKKLAAQKSKVIIKNLPFETSKKDVRALLRQYGQLRTVRVPKKFDSTARGFAFAEFTTAKEAAVAMEALRNTHLLGRKLVMEYAAEDPADAEEQLERMQQKVGAQTNKVVLQNLLGTGRQKFRAGDGGDEELADE